MWPLLLPSGPLPKQTCGQKTESPLEYTSSQTVSDVQKTGFNVSREGRISRHLDVPKGHSPGVSGEHDGWAPRDGRGTSDSPPQQPWHPTWPFTQILGTQQGWCSLLHTRQRSLPASKTLFLTPTHQETQGCFGANFYCTCCRWTAAVTPAV